MDKLLRTNINKLRENMNYIDLTGRSMKYNHGYLQALDDLEKLMAKSEKEKILKICKSV